MSASGLHGKCQIYRTPSTQYVWAHKHTSKRSHFSAIIFTQYKNTLLPCFCVWVLFMSSEKVAHFSDWGWQKFSGYGVRKGWTLGTWSDRINEKQLDDKSAGQACMCTAEGGWDLCSSTENEGINCKHVGCIFKRSSTWQNWIFTQSEREPVIILTL